MRNVIVSILFFAVLVLCCLSYHPWFNRGYNNDVNILTLPIFALTILLFAFSFKMSDLRNKFIWNFLLFFVLIGIEVTIIILASDLVTYSYMKSYILPFCGLVVGYYFKPNSKIFTWGLLVFMGAALVAGIGQVMIGIGGFEIVDFYKALGKNSTGALMATAFAMGLYFLNKTKYLTLKGLFVVYDIIVLILITTMRARTAMLACIFIFLIYLILAFRTSQKRMYLFMAIAFVLFFISFRYFVQGVFISEGIDKYFTEGFYGVHERADVTNGRLDRNIQAIHVISHSPWFGRITYDVPIQWVHNFVLLTLSDFGFIGGALFLCLYFYILWTSCKKLYYQRKVQFNNIGYFVMLVPFFVSLAEPTYPFGPGTAVFAAYVCMGYSLRYSDIKSLQ